MGIDTTEALDRWKDPGEMSLGSRFAISFALHDREFEKASGWSDLGLLSPEGGMPYRSAIILMQRRPQDWLRWPRVLILRESR